MNGINRSQAYQNAQMLIWSRDLWWQDAAFLQHSLEIFGNKTEKIVRKANGDTNSLALILNERLQQFLTNFRNNGTISFVNRKLLKDFHKRVFDKDLVRHLRKEYGIIKREGLKGLVLTIVLRELILSHAKRLKETEDHEESTRLHFQAREVEAKLQQFLQTTTVSVDPLSEEYQRLLRCQFVFHWLNTNYTAKNNKELFLFVAQIIEGPHDKINRLYVSGGRPCRYRKIREELFKFITGVTPRKRGPNKAPVESDDNDNDNDSNQSFRSSPRFTFDTATMGDYQSDPDTGNSLSTTGVPSQYYRINSRMYVTYHH